MASTWFFENLCLIYSDTSRIWKEYDTNPHNILCRKDLKTTDIDIQDLNLCYKYYREAPPELTLTMLETKVPDNIKIFCNWEHNGRECFEDMQINPKNYEDIFTEAFEINGVGKSVKMYLIDNNKILFKFLERP